MQCWADPVLAGRTLHANERSAAAVAIALAAHGRGQLRELNSPALYGVRSGSRAGGTYNGGAAGKPLPASFATDRVRWSRSDSASLARHVWGSAPVGLLQLPVTGAQLLGPGLFGGPVS